MITAISLIFAAAAAAFAVGSWCRRVRASYMAAEHCITEFVSMTQELLANERLPASSKAFLLEIAPFIANKQVAMHVCRRPRPSGASKSPTLWAVDALEDRELKSNYYWAMYLYLTALSHRDRKEGWRLRSVLHGRDRERSAAVPASVVQEKIHDMESYCLPQAA